MQLIKMMSKSIQVFTESPEQSQNSYAQYLFTFVNSVGHVLIQFEISYYSFDLNFFSIYGLNLPHLGNFK